MINDSVSGQIYPQIRINQSIPWVTHNINTCTVFSTCNCGKKHPFTWNIGFMAAIPSTHFVYNRPADRILFLQHSLHWMSLGIFVIKHWNEMKQVFLNMRYCRQIKKRWLWWSYCPLSERKASLLCLFSIIECLQSSFDILPSLSKVKGHWLEHKVWVLRDKKIRIKR